MVDIMRMKFFLIVVSFQAVSASCLLLHCHFYINQRKTLFDSLHDINTSIPNLSDDKLVNDLLYGDNNLYNTEINTFILNCTICFLKSTERLDNALLYFINFDFV